jgi:hypothetical protein
VAASWLGSELLRRLGLWWRLGTGCGGAPLTRRGATETAGDLVPSATPEALHANPPTATRCGRGWLATPPPCAPRGAIRSEVVERTSSCPVGVGRSPLATVGARAAGGGWA